MEQNCEANKIAYNFVILVVRKLLIQLLGGVVVRTLDLRILRRWFESQSRHCLVISEIGDSLWQVNYLGI